MASDLQRARPCDESAAPGILAPYPGRPTPAVQYRRGAARIRSAEGERERLQAGFGGRPSMETRKGTAFGRPHDQVRLTSGPCASIGAKSGLMIARLLSAATALDDDVTHVMATKAMTPLVVVRVVRLATVIRLASCGPLHRGHQTRREASDPSDEGVADTFGWPSSGASAPAQRGAGRGVTSASTSCSVHLIASTIIACISGRSQLASTWPSVV